MSPRTLQLQSSDGRAYSVDIPSPGPQEASGYAFAFYKSGSSLMFSMLQSYSEQMGLSCFSLYDAAFQQGIQTHQIQEDAVACFEHSGYLYLGFRHYPSFSLPLGDSPLLLLVRDPRDILVSLYFSVRNSHVIPEGNIALESERARVLDMEISEFVAQRAVYLQRNFELYRESLLSLDNLKIYRYEDIIYNKGKWMVDMISWLNLPLSQRVAYEVAKRFDVRPKVEDPLNHVRRVKPGDYLEKLPRPVIENLNRQLRGFLAEFDYPETIA